MKKNRKSLIILMLALALVVLFLSAPSTAVAGEYDGLWMAVGIFDSAFIIRHAGDTILVVQVFLSEGGVWNAFYGPISVNKAEIGTLISDINLNAEIDFVNAMTGIMTINSCTSGPKNEECPPDGAQFELNKTF